jgi:Protein of unknown function (DUF3103)
MIIDGVKKWSLVSAGLLSALLLPHVGYGARLEAEREAPARAVGAEAGAQLDKDLETVAIALAKSMKDQEIRSAIKTEALKQFDGDYDILYSVFADVRVSGRTVHQDLTRAGASAGLGGADMWRFSAELGRIRASIPKLQISVPVHIDDWDVASSMPLVAVAPAGDEQKPAYIKAFDAGGKIHWLDANVEPASPVVVVGLSERVDERGQLLNPAPHPVEAAASRNFVETASVLHSVYLYCINVNNLSEDWWNGGPEFRLKIKGPANNEELYFGAYDYQRSERGWHCYNSYLLYNWDYSVHGNELYYVWYEDDGGTGRDWEIDVSFSLPDKIGTFSAKLKWTGRDRDEQIARVRIHKDAPIGHFDDGDYWDFWAGNILEWTFYMQ